MSYKHRTFEDWMAAVNAALVKLCGLHADDLPDWRYADAYEEGLTPSRAARQVLRDA